MFNKLKKNRAIYESMWKNIVERDTPKMIIRRIRIARWIPKATNTHSEYEIRIDFPQQQRLHEGVSILRYTYIAYRVIK
jgi:hypothetical protein